MEGRFAYTNTTKGIWKGRFHKQTLPREYGREGFINKHYKGNMEGKVTYTYTTKEIWKGGLHTQTLPREYGREGYIHIHYNCIDHIFT